MGRHPLQQLTEMSPDHRGPIEWKWCVVAEWLGCRTLYQRVVGSNTGEGKAWYL
jgi:hypothetical protein